MNFRYLQIKKMKVIVNESNCDESDCTILLKQELDKIKNKIIFQKHSFDFEEPEDLERIEPAPSRISIEERPVRQTKNVLRLIIIRIKKKESNALEHHLENNFIFYFIYNSSLF